MVPESRRIARLLLTHPTAEQWDEAMKQQNLLQKKPATARRQARLIRNRLATLDDEGLQLVADCEGELTGQLLLAASARHSQLLSDFMRDVYARTAWGLHPQLTTDGWGPYRLAVNATFAAGMVTVVEATLGLATAAPAQLVK